MVAFEDSLERHDDCWLDDAGKKTSEIVVPYTTAAHTERSIRHAEWLCSGLNARLRIVCVHTVPFPLDLDRSDVLDAEIKRRLRTLDSDLPVSAEIWYRRRDWIGGFLEASPEPRLVIMSHCAKLWPTREGRPRSRLMQGWTHCFFVYGGQCLTF